jgi:hypothetical protein
MECFNLLRISLKLIKVEKIEKVGLKVVVCVNIC